MTVFQTVLFIRNVQFKFQSKSCFLLLSLSYSAVLCDLTVDWDAVRSHVSWCFLSYVVHKPHPGSLTHTWKTGWLPGPNQTRIRMEHNSVLPKLRPGILPTKCHQAVSLMANTLVFGVKSKYIACSFSEGITKLLLEQNSPFLLKLIDQNRFWK